MNWDVIGASSDLVGAVGVIVTLGYLARQIRNNTRETQVAAAQSAINQIYAMTQRDSLYVPALLRLSEQPGGKVDVTEAVMVVTQLSMFMKGYESPELFGTLHHMVAFSLSPPSARDLWAEIKGIHDARFAEYVDSVLAQGDSVLANAAERRSMTYSVARSP